MNETNPRRMNWPEAFAVCFVCVLCAAQPLLWFAAFWYFCLA